MQRILIVIFLGLLFSSVYPQIILNNDTIVKNDSSGIDLNNLPFLAGEVRLVDVMDLLPGIHSYRDNIDEYSILGSPDNQNITIIENTPLLFNSNISINSSILKNITINQTSNNPQFDFGNGSVTTIHLNDYAEKPSISGQLTPVSTQITTEIPITKKLNLFFSANNYFGRKIFDKERNYRQIYIYPRTNPEIQYGLNDEYFFKINYHLNKTNIINVIYSNFSQKQGESIIKKESSQFLNIGWHIRKNEFQLKNGLVFSNISRKSEAFFQSQSVSSNFSFELIRLYSNLKYYLSERNLLQTGINYNRYQLNPYTNNTYDDPTYSLYDIDLGTRYISTSNLFISDNYKLTEWLLFNSSIKMTYYSQYGKGEYIENYNSTYWDTSYFERGVIHKRYFKISPYINITFFPWKKSSIKLDYSKNNQLLHNINPIIDNIGPSYLSEIILPSSTKILPTTNDGIFLSLTQNIKYFQFTSLAFYKKSKNTPTPKKQLVFQDAYYENNIIPNNGKIYGLASSVRKTKGKIQGWINYTYTDSKLQNEFINKNEEFSTSFVKNHEVTALIHYTFGDGLNISSIFKYYSGKNIYLPSYQYNFDGETISSYSSKNTYRTPDYYTLSIAINQQLKTKHLVHTLSLGFCNIINNGENTVFSLSLFDDPPLWGISPYLKYRFQL